MEIKKGLIVVIHGGAFLFDVEVVFCFKFPSILFFFLNLKAIASEE